MSRVVLCLGTNSGDRISHLRSAVRGLADALRVVSGIYQTPPWGDPDQPDYLNAAVIVEDPAVDPAAWLARTQVLEEQAGRVRDPARRYGPRTLDIDIIAAWTSDGVPIVQDDPELILPHPRAHLRAFVLRPWIDIQPYAQLPGHGWVTDLLRTEAVAADLPQLIPRPDLTLE